MSALDGFAGGVVEELGHFAGFATDAFAFGGLHEGVGCLRCVAPACFGVEVGGLEAFGGGALESVPAGGDVVEVDVLGLGAASSFKCGFDAGFEVAAFFFVHQPADFVKERTEFFGPEPWMDSLACEVAVQLVGIVGSDDAIHIDGRGELRWARGLVDDGHLGWVFVELGKVIGGRCAESTSSDDQHSRLRLAFERIVNIYTLDGRSDIVGLCDSSTILAICREDWHPDDDVL